uniref:Protein kinase n=1 Tax=Psychrobacter sp. (strain PRwf-1) TaxID=349106 RepID=A5WGF5_PSYWF
MSTLQVIPFISDNTVPLILQRVDGELTQQGYVPLKARRLGYEASASDTPCYQGMTQAEYKNGVYMIKWQLQPLSTSTDSSLDVEMAHIKQLQRLSVLNQSLMPYQFIKVSTIQIQDEWWQLSGLVMPYFEQGSIKDYLVTQSLTELQKLQLILSVAKSIASLHQAGWIHGDIKLSNFLMAMPKHKRPDAASDWQVVMIDLAYAQAIDRPLFDDSSVINNSLNNSVNDKAALSVMQNHPRGTAAYLAPECWQGQPVSVQSDIYAFGIMLYEMLVGSRPFTVAKAQDLRHSSRLWAVAHCQTPVPLLPSQYQHWQSLIDRLLTKHSQQRPNSMDCVIEVLEQAQYAL